MRGMNDEGGRMKRETGEANRQGPGFPRPLGERVRVRGEMRTAEVRSEKLEARVQKCGRGTESGR